MARELLSEKIVLLGLPYRIKILPSSGGYVAEYNLRGTRWQSRVGGRDPLEAMELAKRWLTTPVGQRA